MITDGLLLPGPVNHAGLHLSALLPDGVTETSVLSTGADRLPDALAAVRDALEVARP